MCALDWRETPQGRRGGQHPAARDFRIKEIDMALLTEDWHGKIHVGGWVRGGGGEQPVTEPATGERLGTIGLASPEDVKAAAAAAAAAQQRRTASVAVADAVERRQQRLWPPPLQQR